MTMQLALPFGVLAIAAIIFAVWRRDERLRRLEQPGGPTIRNQLHRLCHQPQCHVAAGAGARQEREAGRRAVHFETGSQIRVIFGVNFAGHKTAAQ